MTHRELLIQQASQILAALDAIGPGEQFVVFADASGRKHVRISVYSRDTDETTEALVSGTSVRDALAQAAQVLS